MLSVLQKPPIQVIHVGISDAILAAQSDTSVAVKTASHPRNSVIRDLALYHQVQSTGVQPCTPR